MEEQFTDLKLVLLGLQLTVAGVGMALLLTVGVAEKVLVGSILAVVVGGIVSLVGYFGGYSDPAAE